MFEAAQFGSNAGNLPIDFLYGSLYLNHCLWHLKYVWPDSPTGSPKNLNSAATAVEWCLPCFNMTAPPPDLTKCHVIFT